MTRLFESAITHPGRALVAAILLAGVVSGGTTAAIFWLIGDDE